MRAVLDTNVIVSGVISFAGSPFEVVQAWRIGRFTLVVSPEIIEEVAGVLGRSFFRDRRGIAETDVARVRNLLRFDALVVTPRECLTAIAADPADNRILECAVAGEAAWIVSGDHHLLDLRSFRAVQIVTPRDFLSILDRGEQPWPA